jgi:ATP/maltotriose-dependent transcriptional regulator MalT
MRVLVFALMVEVDDDFHDVDQAYIEAGLRSVVEEHPSNMGHHLVTSRYRNSNEDRQWVTW